MTKLKTKLADILPYVLPLFMEGDGIWWAVTIAQILAAIVAMRYLIPEFRKD